jgi:D-3-phosphoglycerate dehydrogenase
VFPIKPSAQGDPFEAELQGLANVILTPQVGGSTQEAQEDIGRFVADKLRDYVATGSSALSGNLPRPVCKEERAHTVSRTFMRTLPVCWPGSTACSLSTTSTSKVKPLDACPPGLPIHRRRHRLCSDVVQALNAMPETVRLRVLS